MKIGSGLHIQDSAKDLRPSTSIFWDLQWLRIRFLASEFPLK